MLRRIIPVVLLLHVLFMVSCAVDKKSAQVHLSGSEITTEWLQYNKLSEEKNAPKLIYLATCKKVIDHDRKYKAVDITDHFSINDERFYIFVRWDNVLDKHLFKLKVLDPRGVLFKEWESLFSYSGPDWVLWSYTFIRNAPAARLPGKWTAEIYMDNNLAANKEFFIGNTETVYKKTNFDQNTPAIAVAKFIYKGEGGNRYEWRMPNYIARMLTIDYPDYKVVLPYEVMKYCSLNEVDDLEASIKSIANSPMLNDLIKKHNIRLLILGSIDDDGLVGKPKTFKTYLIDTRNRTVLNKATAYWSSLHNYDDNFAQLVTYGSHLAYKKTIKEGKNHLDQLAR